MGGFNTTLSSLDRSFQPNQQRNFRINYTIDQMDLTDSYWIFYLKDTGYAFFSAAYGAFFKIDILGYKTSLMNIKLSK